MCEEVRQEMVYRPTGESGFAREASESGSALAVPRVDTHGRTSAEKKRTLIFLARRGQLRPCVRSTVLANIRVGDADRVGYETKLA